MYFYMHSYLHKIFILVKSGCYNGGAKRHRQGDDPDGFNSFPAEAIEGLR
jgi:hypothetical protein